MAKQKNPESNVTVSEETTTLIVALGLTLQSFSRSQKQDFLARLKEQLKISSQTATGDAELLRDSLTQAVDVLLWEVH